MRMQNKTNDQNCKFTYNANAIGTCLNKPKHTSFKDLSARFQSFQGCNFCGDIEETAKAGFFHTGSTDIVQCFFCGLKLRNWNCADNPWVEHARHGKNCAYLNSFKGNDFAKSILQIKENDIETDGNHALYSDDLIFTTAAMALITMGCYKSKEIKEAIRIFVQRNRKIEFTAVEIATVIHNELKQ